MSKYNILYVDDEDVNLRVFYSTFRREFNVFTANSASKGLELLENTKIDLVITDQRMPDITGVEFLKIIHERYPEIPPTRLIVSGFAKDEDIELAFIHYKLFSFVPKPWDAENLKQIIFNAITYGKG
jgi:DNA-binding NtrC family response regulator